MFTKTTPYSLAKGLTSLSAPSTPLSKPIGVASRQVLPHQKLISQPSKARCQRTAASTSGVSSSAAACSSRQAESIAKHLARMQASKAPRVTVQQHLSSSPMFSPKSSLRSSTSAQKVDNSAVEQIAEALSHLTVAASAPLPTFSGSRIPRLATAPKPAATTTGALKSCLAKKVVVKSQLPRRLQARRPEKRVKFVGSFDRTFPKVHVHIVRFQPGTEAVGPSYLRESSKHSPTGWYALEKRPSDPTIRGLNPPDLFDGTERTLCRDCRYAASLGGIVIPAGTGHEELHMEPTDHHADICTIAVRCAEHAVGWDLAWGRIFTRSSVDDLASDKPENGFMPLASASIMSQSALGDCDSENSSRFSPDPEPLPATTPSDLDCGVSEGSSDCLSDSFVSNPMSP